MVDQIFDGNNGDDASFDASNAPSNIPLKGEFSNARLLKDFGFVLALNAYNSVSLRMHSIHDVAEKLSSARSTRRRFAALRRAAVLFAAEDDGEPGLPIDFDFRVGAMPHELITLANFLTLSDGSFDELVADDDAFEQFFCNEHVKLHAKARELLQLCIRERLKAYDSDATAAGDFAALVAASSDPAPSWCSAGWTRDVGGGIAGGSRAHLQWQMAIAVRLGEKHVLEHTAQQLSALQY